MRGRWAPAPTEGKGSRSWKGEVLRGQSAPPAAYSNTISRHANPPPPAAPTSCSACALYRRRSSWVVHAALQRAAVRPSRRHRRVAQRGLADGGGAQDPLPRALRLISVVGAALDGAGGAWRSARLVVGSRGTAAGRRALPGPGPCLAGGRRGRRREVPQDRP